MKDLQELVKNLPREISSYILNNPENGLVLNSGSGTKNVTGKDWYIYSSQESVNIFVFLDNVKKASKYFVLILPNTALTKKKIQSLLTVQDFFLAYVHEGNFLVYVYEKYKGDISEDSKYLFKYNTEKEREVLLGMVDQYIPAVITQNVKLMKVEEEYQNSSVQMALKFRKYMNKNRVFKLFGSILFDILKIGIWGLKLFKKILKFPSILKGRLAELFLKKKVAVISQFLNKESVIVIYAGVKFVDNEGQRSVRLTQEFIKKKQKVLYVYWDFSSSDWNLYGQVNEYLYCMPRSQFLKMYKLIKPALSECDGSKLLIHVPDMEVAKILADFVAMNYLTIYDILDDWEEFSLRGQAIWFDEETEKYILRNVYKRYAVSQGLIKKFKQYNIQLLPNGFSKEQLTDAPKENLNLGKINLGYFGHLTKEWFDWNLVLDIAKKNPEVYIHVIGYGMPDDLALPSNVKFYGKLLPSQLSGYVKNWDVCILPFQDIELSKSVNPIKVYEYLYFGKPVVLTGIPNLEDFPYVYFSHNNEEEFMNLVRKAMNTSLDFRKIEKFLDQNKWEDRANVILDEK